ncbi:glycerol kinase GlpK [Amycolatopsis acidiphila]|uniref:Glycerol kinase n=1 Tax=Amycolatopsis acidiphila TaxID=715473 RepID=A0A558AL70_9PSEU|nr:glycerol kinase GlpK [Amycolatopsis acidiphila]TVT25003.1 glycerol kinase GlpK [Amycolatopsis acidiphila]UIJ57490.1 glycerol kinase GlpK [Amycolatopsis acidiphila]GHG96384.1 glycerol kinase [Amycolatopsis acidiphila]
MTYVAAIDQGTTSTRCILFDHDGSPVASAQREHTQVLPGPGWVEHDPREIWANTRDVVSQALTRAGVSASAIAAVGIANQRETTVVWDRRTGEPVYNAIVWQDTRTARIVRELGEPDRYREVTGLPLATYFAAPKAKWILDNVDGARARAERGELLLGTIDSWLLWNMTGGPDGGVHRTDVTNASRTLLMDLGTLSWDAAIAGELGIPLSMLPEIRPSAEVYGRARGSRVLDGVPIAAALGDQHAATFGQVCFEPGMAKNTYGTGNFVLLNTGERAAPSTNGLLTTVAYQIAGRPPAYALEGSIAVTGSLVQWLRDNLGLIDSAADVETLARTVDDNGGAYFVPAFSGLFAPHWRADARGALVGLTRYVNRGHLARAVLEATAFQVREVVDAMNADAGLELTELRADGGMVGNELLMQFQADLLGVPVVRPRITETTALGAAYAAGLAVGYWSGQDELSALWSEDKRWNPAMTPEARGRTLRQWHKAVQRSLDWADGD